MEISSADTGRCLLGIIHFIKPLKHKHTVRKKEIHLLFTALAKSARLHSCSLMMCQPHLPDYALHLFFFFFQDLYFIYFFIFSEGAPHRTCDGCTSPWFCMFLAFVQYCLISQRHICFTGTYYGYSLLLCCLLAVSLAFRCIIATLCLE